MLTKEFRLKKKTAFIATYKTGKTIHYNGITLFIGKKKDNNNPTRVGFVVSKKIHKRAVRRNRIKRLMRESYRLYIKNNIAPNKYMSLIFVANSKILGKNFEYINATINVLIGKL